MKDDVYQTVFRVSEALEVPVVALALLALALVIVEAGAFVVEALRRRRRRIGVLERAAGAARGHLDADRRDEAATSLQTLAWSPVMARVLAELATTAGRPASEPRVAKLLADFDFACERRLGRTRLLVRLGPALGLMGTLIPLSPALEGLASGDVQTLSDNLRLAFSITVLGLLVGAVAFTLSLVRDRIYGQDYSDLEYVAAVLTQPETAPDPPAATPADGRPPSLAKTGRRAGSA